MLNNVEFSTITLLCFFLGVMCVPVWGACVGVGHMEA